MTETNKLRAVFLAALMFLAVFAGSVALAGSAAADHAEDPSAVAQGPVEYTDSTGNFIEIVFSEGNYSHLTADNVTITDRNGQDVTVNSVSTGGENDSRVVIESAADLTGDATVTVLGESHAVETTSTTAEDNAGDQVIEPFAGENVGILADTAGETVVIEYPDKTVTRGAGDDSFVRTLSDSGNYEAGDWINVTFDGGAGNTTSMQLRDMGLSADTDADTYEQGSDVQATATADHVDREVELRLLNEDGEVVDSQSGTSDSNGEYSDTLSIPSDAATGNYTVVAEDIETGVTAEAGVEVVPEQDVQVDFSESQYSENQGDVAQFSIDVEGTQDPVLVEIGDDEEMGYETHLVATPNEDGELVINMNTYLAGNWSDEDVTIGDVFEAEEGSIDTTHTNTTRVSDDLSGPLEQGLYDLIVSSRNVDDTAWQEEDISALNVEDRSTDGLTVYTAPDAGDVSGETEADEIATGDAVLLEVEATGIYGLLATDDWDGSEATQFDADNELNLEIEQTNEGPNKDPKVVDLSSANVVVDADNKSVWVVIDSDDIADFEAGDNYEASFTATENYEYLDDEEESVNDSFSVVDRTASLDVNSNDEVTVEPAEGQLISGETSVAPGTELRVRARATGESPFLKTAETEVDSDGTFAGEFDFSNINEGQEFTASVRGGNFAEAVEAPGVVQAADPATVSISDQEAEETGDVVTVDSVYLPEGGFVTIHDDSWNDGASFDSVRGTSDYLSEGEHQNVEIQLDDSFDVGDHTVVAMPHEDSNDNQEYDFLDSDGENDGAYMDSNEEAITDSATLSVVEPEEEPTPTETEEPADDDSTEEPTDTATDEPDDQPGFGAVVALIALLGAALLAARRNDF